MRRQRRRHESYSSSGNGSGSDSATSSDDTYSSAGSSSGRGRASDSSSTSGTESSSGRTGSGHRKKVKVRIGLVNPQGYERLVPTKPDSDPANVIFVVQQTNTSTKDGAIRPWLVKVIADVAGDLDIDLTGEGGQVPTRWRRLAKAIRECGKPAVEVMRAIESERMPLMYFEHFREDYSRKWRTSRMNDAFLPLVVETEEALDISLKRPNGKPARTWKELRAAIDACHLQARVVISQLHWQVNLFEDRQLEQDIDSDITHTSEDEYASDSGYESSDSESSS